MAQHNLLGALGEKFARSYLQHKGYKIVEQNHRSKRGEIDIIARHKAWLVFVEVRTTGCEELRTPEETIDFYKKRKLQRNAQAYAFYSRHTGPLRIDAVCIVIDGSKVQRLTHYENIVEDPLV